MVALLTGVSTDCLASVSRLFVSPVARGRGLRKGSAHGHQRLADQRRFGPWLRSAHRHTSGMDDVTVRRVDFGYFVRPLEETGTGKPRVEPCLGYLVVHPEGTLLFDTGMGGDSWVNQHYRPRRTVLDQALRSVDANVDDIDLVANCHLHFDHCGGNAFFAGKPIFTQASELVAARTVVDYTLAKLIDTPGTRYEELAGEAEVLPGVILIPTPGHTEGHQSLVVRKSDGTVVVAGQSHDTATAYSADALAWRAHRDNHPQPLPVPPTWLDRLQQLDPSRVVFAHDHAVWEP
jgi:N-acyl homoserine lactone hydrolase